MRRDADPRRRHVRHADVVHAPWRRGPLGQVVATFASPVGARQVFVGGTGVAPTTPVTWGTPTKPGGSYAWNFGNALARTVRDGSQRLHQAYATDRIGGTWAKDSGPYAGLYYTRSTTGSTWTTPRRITSTSRHVVRFGLAAAGSRVYAAYVTQTKIVNYSGSAPRVLYVRVNTNHGHGDYWKSSVRLTGTTGRVDFPTVAASGTDVHIAFTNANNGDIIVATSKDRGVTWVKRTVGTTTFNTSSGRAGLPSVAVSGSTVAVTWIADGDGALRTRVSTDRGSTWGGTEEHTDGSSGEFQTAVLGSRVGVAWTGEDGVFTRIRTSGTWADTRQRGSRRELRGVLAVDRPLGHGSRRDLVGGGHGDDELDRPQVRRVHEQRRRLVPGTDDRLDVDLHPPGERLPVDRVAEHGDPLRVLERLDERHQQLPALPAQGNRDTGRAGGGCARRVDRVALRR